ncbi:MAG: hypothetical protein B6I22_14740 [Desulfobacteraceae bacterium 4572_123]|nr:MAG: hypothetical protein B6I22_14740 [Desulfobacteraceae bacterium 4572_123]
MIIIKILFAVAILYVLVATVYLLVLTLAAWRFKKKTDPTAGPLKIAVIVPAHNEADQIQTTLKSIADSAYAREDYRICVIADNCEDDTANLARDAGARVFERTDIANRGKGQALDWLFTTHPEVYHDFDALAVVDADTLLHRDFLSEVSASLSHPEVKVVQGYYGVSNPNDNWRSALASAALNVFHHVRPAGRNRIKGTAGLKGNGMAFLSEIIEKYGWPAYSIVEDIEFSMQLLLDGILVHYNPDAIVYGEMATEKKQAETQRKRWEGGRWQVFKTYGPGLIRKFVRQIVLFICTALFYPGLSPALVLCLLSIVFYVFSGLLLKRASFYVWKSLFMAPFFILWKIPIYLKIVKSGDDNTWERTKRQAEMNKKK